uniref:Uncharacterized protein n=1 Tax=Anguilla anguilla TaxID=7936 RepID=A0A0E9X7E9_ANGAN
MFIRNPEGVLFKVKSSLQSRVLIQHSSADSGW